MSIRDIFHSFSPAGLKAQFLADTRKTALLAGLVVAAAGLAVWQFGHRTAPRSAAAAVQPAAPADVVEAIVAPKAAPADQAAHRYLAALDRTALRDPFEVRWSAFVPAGPPNGGEAEGPGAFDPAAAAQQAEALSVRTRAQGLKLQSAIGGQRPTAILNDQVVGVGETVDGFQVRRIGQGFCVVEMNGLEITLHME